MTEESESSGGLRPDPLTRTAPTLALPGGIEQLDETAPLPDPLAFDETLARTLGLDETSAPAAPPATPQIGRYLVLERLGEGAMGVVFAAYDPKLDRKVALKLLTARGSLAARQRLEREAQSLAKLAHPNVVAVYDVDVHAGQHFVAMELVAGRTLGAWMDEAMQSGLPRPWREVLPVFGPAGRGLAAAHGAGLVHRDFKPENVMLGDDGRVRVMDFGLAQHAEIARSDSLPPPLDPLPLDLTQTGAAVGTPAYMAPEQFEGQADERSDQFGFCVALYEALYGQRPFTNVGLAELLEAMDSGVFEPLQVPNSVPAWLRTVVMRGLEVEPAARWPSMDALLEALADDPAQRRQRWLLGAAVLALVGTAAASASLWTAQQQPPRPDPCAGFERHLEGIWDEPRREAVTYALTETGLSYAGDAAERVTARLDDYTTRWVGAREQACTASQRGEQSGALLDRRMRCLDEHLQHVESTVAVLTEADKSVTRKAVAAVAGLPPLEACADLDALTAARPPPNDPDLAERVEAVQTQRIEAQSLKRAGKSRAALKLAEANVSMAEDLDYEPIQVEVWLSAARIVLSAGTPERTRELLERAHSSALALQMSAEAAETARLLMRLHATSLAQPEEAESWASRAEALTRAEGSPRSRADYLASASILAWTQGDYAKAHELGEQSLELRVRLLDRAHPDLASSLVNLGSVAGMLGELKRSRAHLERALEIYERALGPHHPTVATTMLNLAMTLGIGGAGSFEEAHELLARAAEILEAALGPEHPKLAKALTGLGVACEQLGRPDEARAHHERALAILENARGPEHPSLAEIRTNLGMLAYSQQRLDEAREQFAAALAIFETALGPTHPELAVHHTNLGSVALLQGRHDDARTRFGRALELWEGSLDPDSPRLSPALSGLGEALIELGRPDEALPPLERSIELLTTADGPTSELSLARFLLARALWDSDTDRARAQTLATRAAREFEAMGAPELERVHSWLAAHP